MNNIQIAQEAVAAGHAAMEACLKQHNMKHCNVYLCILLREEGNKTFQCLNKSKDVMLALVPNETLFFTNENNPSSNIVMNWQKYIRLYVSSNRTGSPTRLTISSLDDPQEYIVIHDEESCRKAFSFLSDHPVHELVFFLN